MDSAAISAVGGALASVLRFAYFVWGVLPFGMVALKVLFSKPGFIPIWHVPILTILALGDLALFVKLDADISKYGVAVPALVLAQIPVVFFFYRSVDSRE